VDLHVSKVRRGARNKAKALGLKHFQSPDVGADLQMGMRAVPRLCINLVLEFALQLRKITVKLQSETRKVLGLLVPSTNRLVDLTIGGLDWLAGTHRARSTIRKTGPTLGLSRYLPRFTTSANFESKLAASALMLSTNKGTPKFS